MGRQVLDENYLASLPPSIGGMASLTHLSAQKNQLAVLPDAISSLQRLKTLNLDHNLLTDLPFAAMAALSSLSSLHLAHNRLTSAPFELFSSSALTRIHLQGNEQLRSPPPRVVNDPAHQDAVVAFLRLEAKALQSGRLLLQGHKLEHFPMEMFRIPEVTEINLSENRLDFIAPEIQTLQVSQAPDLYLSKSTSRMRISRRSIVR